MALEGMIPCLAGEAWGMCDANGRFIKLSPGFAMTWQMLALSGGKPIEVFGEWNGEDLWPLSLYADERWINLYVPGSET
jgi:hypothetical protein